MTLLVPGTERLFLAGELGRPVGGALQTRTWLHGAGENLPETPGVRGPGWRRAHLGPQRTADAFPWLPGGSPREQRRIVMGWAVNELQASATLLNSCPEAPPCEKQSIGGILLFQ